MENGELKIDHSSFSIFYLHEAEMIMQLKFRKYNYMLMQKPVGVCSNEKAPCGRHSKPVTPLGFHYPSEYKRELTPPPMFYRPYRAPAYDLDLICET